MAHTELTTKEMTDISLTVVNSTDSEKKMLSKTISIEEFYSFGYLQEVNRAFFHPLGLALSVVHSDTTGTLRLGPILDGREDPEGIRYVAPSAFDPQKTQNIINEWSVRSKARLAGLGYVIQPITDPALTGKADETDDTPQ